MTLTQKPNVLSNRLQSRQCRNKWNEIPTHNLKLTDHGCHGRQVGQRLSFLSARALVHGLLEQVSNNKTPSLCTRLEQYTYHSCLFLIIILKRPRFGLACCCCCWIFLSKNDKRKIKRPTWKYYEGYAYRTSDLSGACRTWKMTAICSLYSTS